MARKSATSSATSSSAPSRSAAPKRASAAGKSRQRGPLQWSELLEFPLQEQRQLVAAGLPYATVTTLQTALGLTLAELADLVMIQLRTLTRRRDAGRLEADESDRVLRAARIFARASGLFAGDEEKARTWLRTGNRALGGETPLAFARTEVGAREVEAVIGRLEHGVVT
jgi:putative toxin-antitoxin system antitoxin component (TIGR02293 family)